MNCSLNNVSVADIEYVFNIINNMRNTVLEQENANYEDYKREQEQQPIFCGYITTYQKQDGTVFRKRTKNMPYDYSSHIILYENYVNQYGHKVISIEKDYQLNLGIDIDMNKKWYI
jgi:hypothetical protein